MNISLRQIIELVGNLDDGPGENTPRERFRNHLRENIKEIGEVRDLIEECLREAGDQYSRALQDLINHLGHFLGFKVNFGRYKGIVGEIGYDGYWVSPTNRHLVVEAKTTQAYAIKTSSIIGYINELISEKKIPEKELALGLYVVGRPDPNITQFENAIIAEKRSDELRVVSVESLLSLAEMMEEYDITHEDIMAVLLPSGPNADSIVDLMIRMAAQKKQEIAPAEVINTVTHVDEETTYWLTPVKSDGKITAEETILSLVGKNHIYAFGERTPGRKHIKIGDWVCFYATGKGVIAHAKVVSLPENSPHGAVRNSKKYPWTFKIDTEEIYIEEPVVVDAAKRAKLEAFSGRDIESSWAWFVQETHKLARNDFYNLIRR